MGIVATEGLQKLFYFLKIFISSLHPAYKFVTLRNMFQSFTYEPRKLQATEARLQAIYNAAKLGLKGDSLALAAGMTPTEYRQLVLFDEIAEYAELKGRADGERELSQVLHAAAAEGDAKAALEILKHQHGWVAKQQLSVDVEQRISITAALEQAQARVINAISLQDQPQSIEFREIPKEQKAA